ncbi:hypothetical protein E4U33_004093 [Claviceps sp. LM78 group G4]|nr:hypothetical protein E4U33_004093 [Claviceps sp. LM78 group G4]
MSPENDEQSQRSIKCDLGQPSCSRCLQYDIRCVGSGEMVYRFKDSQTPWYAYRDPENLGHLVQHVGQHGKELKPFEISSGHRKYFLEMK